MNEEDRVVSWTRKLNSKPIYEHGRLEVYPANHAGVGSVFYSPESDSGSLNNGDVVQFHAVVPGSHGDAMLPLLPLKGFMRVVSRPDGL